MTRTRFALTALAVLFAASAVQAQATATVKCTDGTSSSGGKGACSAHGGVAAAKAAAAAKAKAKAAAKADAKADSKMKGMKMDAKVDGPAAAACKDGTQSFATNHTGACSKHGGVKEWIDGTAIKP